MSAPKEKRRNSEKRKEKSRNAARCRREKETDLFYQLGHMLPLPHKVCSNLDKAGIMRLVLCHLKIQKNLPAENQVSIKMEEDVELTDAESRLLDKESMLEPCYTKALEGFLIILSKEGDIVYISDNVHRYLGLTQIDLLGQSIYEYSHPCDHEDIREELSDRPGLNYISPKPERKHHSFLMRLKCTLTPKGKSVNLKSATYKVVQCTGHLKLSEIDAAAFGEMRHPVPCLILVACPIPHPVNIETPLDSKTFMTRHSMDMKFTDCDERIKDLIGYSPDDLVGRSFYDFHHAMDCTQIERCHRNLFAKGQTSTGHYRFLAKKGGYVWLETQATVIFHNKTNKAECVVCVNYVLSGLEQDDTPISLDQIQSSRDYNGVQLSTEKIFAPRQASEEEEYPAWLMSDKEQASDVDFLKTLAPIAGDSIIPLIYPSRSNFSSKDKEDEPVQEAKKNVVKRAVPLTPKIEISRPMPTATNQVLFGQPGTVVDIPQKELELPDKNGPLNSSHDPLLTTESPNKGTDKKLFPDLLSEEDLAFYAPYMPMGEDLDLSVDLERSSQEFEPNSSWQPVNPFAHDLEKEGFTPYNQGTPDHVPPPFIPSSEFSCQPRSPPSLLSSPTVASPSSPSSSFGGSMPNLCPYPAATSSFSPINSPLVPDLYEYPSPPASQGMVTSPLPPRTTIEQTMVSQGTTILGGLTGLIGGKPPDYALPTSMALKRKMLEPLTVDTGQPQQHQRWSGMVLDQRPISRPLPEKIRGIDPRYNPTFAANRRTMPSKTLFSHSNLLQQVAQSHTINCNRGRPRLGGFAELPSRGKVFPHFGQSREDATSPTTLQMDELCRILNMKT